MHRDKNINKILACCFIVVGDGMCCGYGNGYYKVTLNGVVQKEGGQFTSSVVTKFGSCNNSLVRKPASHTTSNRCFFGSLGVH